MIFLRSWLEDYIDLSGYSNAQIADVLTRRSAEVEEILSIKDYFKAKVLIGQIKNTRKHPDADRLQIFDLDLGNQESVQIVSAASNVTDGLAVPVALNGAKLAGMSIAPRKMRGVESNGMCLGMSELMLETDFSTGLWELNEILSAKGDLKTFLGKSICEVLPEYFEVQTAFDIKVLPDKISVIGNHLGMALELAICFENLDLLTPKASLVLDPQTFLEKARSQFGRLSLAPKKAQFEDENNYANAFWLFKIKLEGGYNLPHQWRTRMFLTDRNQIGGPADLSNYLLADIGQPTHFFSTQKLIRLNENGQNYDQTETEINLNWQIKKLENVTPFEGLGQLKSTQVPQNVDVLYDGNGNFLTIPGISGGEQTKVDETETDIIVEIANFTGQKVAKNSFALNYRSDGGKIWAGGVNLALIPLALYSLLEALPQAKVEILLDYVNDDITIDGDFEQNLNALLDTVEALNVDFDYLASRLDDRGSDYWRPIIEEKLGFIGRLNDGILQPNIFYSNLEKQEDILAEVVRLVGFAGLQKQDLQVGSRKSDQSEFQILESIKNLATSYGFSEIITRPFVASKHLVQTWLGQSEKTAYKILNPYNSLQPYLRDSLLPSLLQSGFENVQRGSKIYLYEVNKVYTQGPTSKQKIGLLSETNDPYQLTSLLYEFAKKSDLKITKYEPLFAEWASVGDGVLYTISNDIQAMLIELKASLKKEFGLPLQRKLWYLEIDLTNFKGVWNDYKSYFDESDYPSIKRSYSLFVPNSLMWSKVEELFASQDLLGVSSFINPTERIIHDDTQDILNFEVEFRSYERTLQSSEVEKWESELFDKLSQFGNVQFR